jgi:predicted negative regulator of RcsB-dependent stress response
MTTSVTTAARGTAAAETGAWAWLVQWIKGHKQVAGYIGVAAVIGAVLFGWNLLSTRTAERNASIRLDQARLAVESRNYPLAASELSQLVENYAGTRSAEEGTLLLAKVRLAQGQSDVAIDVLTKFAPDASRAYRAQAYGLLGAAYENVARPKDAAEAYERAADAAEFPFLRAQFLSDAGRAWATAGDTTKALAAYRAITTQLDSTSGVTEALVRIGELTKGARAQ